MKTGEIRVVPFAERTYKEIQLHLQDGQVISLPLLDAEMVDMGNGHLFIIGKVLESRERNPNTTVHNLPQITSWRQ